MKTKTAEGVTVLLTGWVTVQSEDYMSWKRRHFQLREDALVLFKDAEVSVVAYFEVRARLRIQRLGPLAASRDNRAFPYSAHSRVARRL